MVEQDPGIFSSTWLVAINLLPRLQLEARADQVADAVAHACGGRYFTLSVDWPPRSIRKLDCHV